MTDSTTLYFAYGSNLNATDWARWCAERPKGADPACMRPVGTALLPDHILTFSRHSVAREGGVLDIRPRPGHAVEGVLMAVTSAGWELLDIKEGVGFAYEQVPVRVVGADGFWRDVSTYRVLPGEARAHVPPHAHYVSVCADGLRAHGLEPHRLLDAAADRRPRPAAAGMFLDEALRKTMAAVLSEAEHAALEPASASATPHAAGALSRGGGTVPGVFLPSAALEDLVERLDPLAGAGTVRFARDMVAVTTGAGATHRAWTYVVPQIT